MNVEVITLSDNTIRFLLDGVDVAFANALRRTMISEVPIMAIEDIFFFDNSSIVPDEIIANRVGLTPLITDLDSYVLPEKCDCGAELGCAKCRVVLTLDVEAVDDTITVYSGDLTSEDPMIKPASPKIILSKLAPGQAIRFEAYAQLGQGKNHTKWSPVSMCVYQNVSLIELENIDKVKACIDECDDKVVSLDGNKLKIIDIQAFEKHNICRESVPHELILSSLKSDEFLFTVESTGTLPPLRIVTEAINVLKEKLDILDDKIDRDDIHDEITDFEAPEQEEGRLYSVGSGDYDEEDEDVDVESEELME